MIAPDLQTVESRRQVLRWGLRAGGLFLLGGLGLPLGARRGLGQAADTGRRGAGGFELLDIVPFADEGRNFVGVLGGEGRDGRRAHDLTRLTSKRLVTPTEEFFIRTRHPAALGSPDGWTISVEGLVDEPRTLHVEQLEAMRVPLGVHLCECAGSTRNSGFGLMSAADWEGVPLTGLLSQLAAAPGSRVLVSGVDPETGAFPGGNWIFHPEELAAAGAALATRMNGAPLPADHGRPVRLVMPGWYGCCWVKWVDRIVFVADVAQATSQMREFAGRTHQAGIPKLARDYRPATVDSAAMPVRVEMWRGPDGIFYRLVGVTWGGSDPTARPSVRLGPDGPYVPVERFEPDSASTWTLWSHLWRPERPGRYAIELRFEDPALLTRRMDAGHYRRSVVIPEV